MTHILCLETSTRNCSVALVEDGAVKAVAEVASEQYSHAERLHAMIDDVVGEAGLQPGDLDAVAVGAGPGSFTGLRIGAAAAKGLCAALNVPLIAISSLELLAIQGRTSAPKAQHIVPAIDARRMEIYTLNARGKAEAVVVEQDFCQELEGRALLIGDGAVKCQDILADSKVDWTFQEAYPTATAMAGLATAKFEKEQFEDVARFEPDYLKAFVAGRPKDPLGLRKTANGNAQNLGS